MRLIERYIFRNAALAFVTALLGLTGVIWVAEALREIGLLTAKGQSFVTFLKVTGLAVPSLVLMIVPIALFIAVLYTLNRLNGDSELVVMSGSGCRPATVLKPFLVLTLLALALDASMSLVAVPASYHALRKLMTQVEASFITQIVQPGQFTSLEDGFVFHYRERGPNGELLGVFMQDRRDLEHVRTYVAEDGRTAQQDEMTCLVLRHGDLQTKDAKSRDTSFIVFEDYALDLAEFAAAQTSSPMKPKERTTAALLHLDWKEPFEARQRGKFRAELHDRFVSPLYTLVALVTGFVCLGQARTARQSRAVSLTLAIVAFTLLRAGGIGVSMLVLRSSAMVAVAYALPLAAFLSGLVMVFGPPSFRRPAPLVHRPTAVAVGLS